MKLTIQCPKCGERYDKGLVKEIPDMVSVDLVEFMNGDYVCSSCGHKQKIASILPYSPQGKYIY